MPIMHFSLFLHLAASRSILAPSEKPVFTKEYEDRHQVCTGSAVAATQKQILLLFPTHGPREDGRCSFTAQQ